MANPMKSVAKSIPQPAELEAALEGARRASADAASSGAPAQPEVVAIARRRQFSASEKRRILAEADRCSEPGQIGALPTARRHLFVQPGGVAQAPCR